MSFYKNIKEQRGFTLLEVLGVLVILGVLLGLGIPKVMNVINDSDTEEFVSNAKVLEDASHLYYRDNGVLPYTENKKVAWDKSTASAEDFILDEDSKAIIISRLIEVGTENPYSVLRSLVEDDKLTFLNYDELREYSKITSSDEGADEFLLVDFVDTLTEDRYANYENELAGYVFSYNVRDKSTGIIYSGAYDITQEELDKIKGTLDKCATLTKEECDVLISESIDDNDELLDSLSNKALAPYGLKAVKSTNKKNGTYDIQVAFTNRVVGTKFEKNDKPEDVPVPLSELDSSTLNTYKNIKAKSFTLTLYSYENDATKKVTASQDFKFKQNTNGKYTVTTSGTWGLKDSNGGTSNEVVVTNNTFKVEVTGINHKLSSTELYGVKMKDTELVYRNKVLKYFKTESGKSYVNIAPKNEKDVSGNQKGTFIVYDDNLNILNLDNSDSGTGGGKINACDMESASLKDCGLIQIIPEPSIEEPFENYYQTYKENTNFGIVPKFHGLYLTNIEKGDLVVVKEAHRTKGYDWNRTVAFQSLRSSNDTDLDLYIPKSFLQKDFQINPKSQYIYIVEVYKEDYLDNTTDAPTIPKYAKSVEYK